jgi:hypothetical protein
MICSDFPPEVVQSLMQVCTCTATLSTVVWLLLNLCLRVHELHAGDGQEGV